MAGVKQPDDKSYFILPDLGEGVAEAELIEWKVKPGDKVEEHQTLAEMETDKARVEVPSPWEGVIGELPWNAGDIVDVGAKLLTYQINGGSASSKAAGKNNASSSKTNNPDLVETRAKSSPEPAEIEETEREDAGTVVGSVGAEVKISDRFARKPESNGTTNGQAKALATPAVRRIAREKGIDINAIAGSGRGGRITASDVEMFAGGGGSDTGSARGSASPQAAPSAPKVNISADGIAKRIPFRGIRRKIAQALDQSVKTAVHFTVVDEADVSALEMKRKELMYATGEKLSLLPFIMTAVCKGLRKHPTLNANVDDANAEILIKSVINLGCAVDTDDGLMVPVLHNADASSLVELSNRVGDVASRCKSRTIPREELTGGTFTISNVGSYGGMFATPIINYPEVAILAAGRAKDQVVPRHGGFYLGKVLPLSLSCDHRVVDGAEGARFLNTVVKLLENPPELLRP